MQETYTANEFAACFSLRGYGRKKDALKWLEENGIETAVESDFEKRYYDLNERKVVAHGRRYNSMWIDGQNQSAPHNQPNSKGMSFNEEMRRAQLAIDATDRWIRKQKECDEP